MDIDNHMIDARLIPVEDHRMLIEKICNSALSMGAVRSYTNSHRLGLGALAKSNASFLDIPIHQRYRGTAAHVIVTNLSDRLRAIDVIREARQIRHVVELLTESCCDEFDTEISRIQVIATSSGSVVRLNRPRKGVTLDEGLPKDHLDGVERLRNGSRKDGNHLAVSVVEGGLAEYLLFLGVMERARVPWRDMNASELFQRTYFDILIDEWCCLDQNSSRVSKLVHILKVMFPTSDFSCASEAMSERRAKAPTSMTSRGVKWSVSIDELPEEEAERFAFACPEYAAKRNMSVYSPNEVDFEFNWISVELEKKAAREVSQENFLSALRAMVSELRISAPDQLMLPIDKRDYGLIAKLFHDRYKGYQPASRAARMDNLLGLLQRILPRQVDITELAKLVKSARSAVEQKPVVVPDLKPVQVRDQALSIVERSYIRAKDLLSCSKPYMPPEQHLILFRDSLMIAFLAMEPLRRNSMRQFNADDLGEININEVIFAHARVDKHRMKNGKTHDFVVDRVLDPWIKLYIREVRTLIAPSYDGPAFWVSKFNTRLSNSSIGRIVPRTSLLIIGTRLAPHTFRRIVATDEISSGKASEKLTHSNTEITEKYQDKISLLQVCRDTSLKGIGAKHWP